MTNTETMKTAFATYAKALVTNVTVEELNDMVSGIIAFSLWCHEAQVKAGWWSDPATGKRKARNHGQLIALMHSEVSEALEADRKNKNDDKLPHRLGVEVELADMLIRMGDFIGGIEEADEFAFRVRAGLEYNEPKGKENSDPFSEIHMKLSGAYGVVNGDRFDLVFWLAYAFRTTLELATQRGLDLWSAIEEKTAYNARRPDHKLENRKLEGGKAY